MTGVMNGSLTPDKSWQRDNGAIQPTTLNLAVRVWPDGSARASVDNFELVDFVKEARKTPLGVARVVVMLREAALLIEKGAI